MFVINGTDTGTESAHTLTAVNIVVPASTNPYPSTPGNRPGRAYRDAGLRGRVRRSRGNRLRIPQGFLWLRPSRRCQRKFGALVSVRAPRRYIRRGGKQRLRRPENRHSGQYWIHQGRTRTDHNRRALTFRGLAAWISARLRGRKARPGRILGGKKNGASPLAPNPTRSDSTFIAVFTAGLTMALAYATFRRK